jgi:hypothetical protein
VWASSPHINGSFWEYRLNIRQCVPKAQEMMPVFFLQIQELSHEITLSRDQSGMQHKLLHHFVAALRKNHYSGMTRFVLLPNIIKIKQLRRTPMHPMVPLPFAYHEIIFLLQDAKITHFQPCSTSEVYHQNDNSIPGVYDTIVGADQLRPHRPAAHQGRTLTPQQNARPDGAPIRCEICLDCFGFSGHDALRCPFLHPDNIKDCENKHSFLQYKITNSMKQDPVPDKLKEAIKLRTVPLQARVSKPVVRFAEADAPPFYG